MKGDETSLIAAWIDRNSLAREFKPGGNIHGDVTGHQGGNSGPSNIAKLTEQASISEHSGSLA